MNFSPLGHTSLSRRRFLKGMAGILAAGAAPAVLSSGVIMPIKKLWVPDQGLEIGFDYVSPLIWKISKIQQYQHAVTMDVLRAMTA